MQPSHPLSSLLLLSIFPSIRVFSDELGLHIKWPMYLSFSFSINPSNEYSGLISFSMDWLDLLAVWGDSQQSSSTPQLTIINSLMLSLLYGPTLISIYDCAKEAKVEWFYEDLQDHLEITHSATPPPKKKIKGFSLFHWQPQKRHYLYVNVFSWAFNILK